MFNRDVTRARSNRKPRRVNSRRDRRVFSGTADMIHEANSVRKPMRGGIRL